MDLFPKFIIETDEELGDCLILGKCTYHKDLATNKNKIKGGGAYRYNPDNNSFTFYGKSFDFGPAQIEDIKKTIEEGKVFTTPMLIYDISKRYIFFYDTQTEIIKLN